MKINGVRCALLGLTNTSKIFMLTFVYLRLLGKI